MFTLTDEQRRKLQEWVTAQHTKVADIQKGMDYPFSTDKPYYGACGGAFTYSFTPTSLGCGVSVRNNVTKEEIDLTEYDIW